MASPAATVALHCESSWAQPRTQHLGSAGLSHTTFVASVRRTSLGRPLSVEHNGGVTCAQADMGRDSPTSVSEVPSQRQDQKAQPGTEPVPQKKSTRDLGFEEYEELKQELLQLTANISGLGTAYCFLAFSLESALSYAFGCGLSVLYLQELVKAADSTSKSSIPKVFQGRQRRKSSTSLIEQLALLSSPERLGAGIQLALSSRRLLFPTALMLFWALSRAATGGDPAAIHLELAPLFLGFLTYKAAVLVITLKGQADLLQ